MTCWLEDVLLGLLALVQLPITLFPSISPPKVNVTASYPGANNELLIKSVIILLFQQKKQKLALLMKEWMKIKFGL